LEVAREGERARLRELEAAREAAVRAAGENRALQERVAALGQRLEELFARAADTQTANQVLQARASEAVMRAQIDAERARALEQMRADADAELERARTLATALVAEREAANRCVARLERELAEAHRAGLDREAEHALRAPDARAEVPRIIRLYQQRAGLYQDQLDRRAREVLELKTKRAVDQRTLIELQRELSRTRTELRMTAMRYEASKAEQIASQQAIGNRDETIRALKREIERLRNLLRMKSPIQQQWRAIQKLENDNEGNVHETRAQIAKAYAARKRYEDMPAVVSYFDKMLMRDQEKLARLEVRRRQFREQRELNAIESLRAVSHIVQEAEISVPESVVMQMMPRPSPVRNLPRRGVVDDLDFDGPGPLPPLPRPGPRFETASYAETLGMLGQLVGKKSPRTLQEMLRNARHARPVLAAREIPKPPPPPMASGLTVKPVRPL
jgi:hypothetical protein